jgi:hypothetical protein
LLLREQLILSDATLLRGSALLGKGVLLLTFTSYAYLCDINQSYSSLANKKIKQQSFLSLPTKGHT